MAMAIRRVRSLGLPSRAFCFDSERYSVESWQGEYHEARDGSPGLRSGCGRCML